MAGIGMRKEGLTIRDIAEEMHMSEGYVHKCIRRCWNHIQEKMQGLKDMPHMPKDPSASFGWSIHEPSQPLSFDDHLNEADDRMYEEKEKYKLTHPAEAGRNFKREK